jgi:hypothetical protein
VEEDPEEEEEGGMVISPRAEEINRGESLILKKSVCKVPNFEEVVN